MNPMKKKPMRILFSLLLVAVLVSTFSMTAFAAGDVVLLTMYDSRLRQAMWQVQSRILGMLPRAKFRR